MEKRHVIVFGLFAALFLAGLLVPRGAKADGIANTSTSDAAAQLCVAAWIDVTLAGAPITFSTLQQGADHNNETDLASGYMTVDINEPTNTETNLSVNASAVFTGWYSAAGYTFAIGNLSVWVENTTTAACYEAPNCLPPGNNALFPVLPVYFWANRTNMTTSFQDAYKYIPHNYTNYVVMLRHDANIPPSQHGGWYNATETVKVTDAYSGGCS